MARNKFDVDEKLETPFQWKHFKRAGKYIARHKYKMMLALLLSALSSMATLYIPKITVWVLDEAVPNKDTAMIGKMALLFVGLVCLSILFTTIRSRMMAHVSQRIIYDIRGDLFAHLQKLPFSYYDSRPAGKILVRVINYVNSVSDILSNGIINMILEIINLVFIVVFMYSTNATLATVIVAGLPIFAGIIILIKPRQRRAWQNQSNKNSNYNAYLAESIDGVRVSQLFDRQEVNIGIMRRLASACRDAWLKAVYISNTVWLSSQGMTQLVLTFLYIAGVYWMGGAMVSAGVILAMAQYVSRFWQPITNLANIYNSFVNNIAYLERIFETMDEPVVVDDAPDAETLPEISGEVDFEDVTFAYEEGVNMNMDYVKKTYGEFIRKHHISPEAVAEYLQMEGGTFKKVYDETMAKQKAETEEIRKNFNAQGEALKKAYNPQQIDTAVKALATFSDDKDFMQVATTNLSNNPTLVKLLLNWAEHNSVDDTAGAGAGAGTGGALAGFAERWTGKKI